MRKRDPQASLADAASSRKLSRFSELTVGQPAPCSETYSVAALEIRAAARSELSTRLLARLFVSAYRLPETVSVSATAMSPASKRVTPRWECRDDAGIAIMPSREQGMCQGRSHALWCVFSHRAGKFPAAGRRTAGHFGVSPGGTYDTLSGGGYGRR